MIFRKLDIDIDVDIIMAVGNRRRKRCVAWVWCVAAAHYCVKSFPIKRHLWLN